MTSSPIVLRENEVLLEGFLTSEKLWEALLRITSIAASLKFEVIFITVSSFGGDHAAITDFVKAAGVIPNIKFQVEIEKAGLEGERIASALSKKN